MTYMTTCDSGKFSTAPPPPTNVPVRSWLVNFLQSQPPCQHCLWEETGVTRAMANTGVTIKTETRMRQAVIMKYLPEYGFAWKVSP